MPARFDRGDRGGKEEDFDESRDTCITRKRLTRGLDGRGVNESCKMDERQTIRQRSERG